MASSMAITAVTTTCSSLSVIGAGFILLCYTILPLDRHFRHVLILNLALSDFLNSLNNTVAGIYILVRRQGLVPGPGCTFNGFAGQATVQSTDCTILAIAIATVWTIVKRESRSQALIWGPKQIVLVCSAIWALPLTTAFLGLGMEWYTPASGDWCWIEPKPVYLRYVLTHGWRFFFIVIEIILYVYLDIHLRRHYNNLSDSLPQDVGQNPRFSGLSAIIRPTGNRHSQPESTTISLDTSGAGDRSPIINGFPKPIALSATFSTTPDSKSGQSKIPFSWSFGCITGLRETQPPSPRSTSPRYQAIKRILLLNAYPLAYIILWIPGIVNRCIEAAGKKSTLAQFFQASAQLVGLANALTYGWNEKVATRLRERFSTGKIVSPA